jgi:hypothetical protein
MARVTKSLCVHNDGSAGDETLHVDPKPLGRVIVLAQLHPRLVFIVPGNDQHQVAIERLGARNRDLNPLPKTQAS